MFFRAFRNNFELGLYRGQLLDIEIYNNGLFQLGNYNNSSRYPGKLDQVMLPMTDSAGSGSDV